MLRAFSKRARTLRGVALMVVGLFIVQFYIFQRTPSHSLPISSNILPPDRKDAGQHNKPTNRRVSSPGNSSKPSTSWCEPDECTNGRWEPRRPAFTSLEDFQAAYANRQDHVWKGCRAIPDSSGKPRTESEQRKADELRLMEVMGWTWVPYVGQMREWNAEEFVIRLLKSPGGLILIGDSITQQHHHSLGYLLGQADIRFDVDPPTVPLHSHKNVHQHLLKRDDPKTHQLLARAGVPASRLDRPVMTMLEDHMLIGEKDIRAITERLGASKTYYWYHDFQRVEGWEAFVQDAAKPREGEEDTVYEDTILFMNAGAHWSRHELAMLPARATDKDEQARVKETYKQMVKLITTRISHISRLSVYYRSTSPGHPVCEKRALPYHDAPSAKTAEQHVVERLKAQVHTVDLKKQRARWDWDLFEVHNEVWKRAIGRLVRERNWRRWQTTRKLGARWYYVDLWDQALQRPDSHSEPGIDCLHWCLPSILNQWTAHLYHLMFLETISAEDSDRTDTPH